MRRKTDFFTQDDNSAKVVMKHMTTHQRLFKDDKQKQELIRQKKAELAEKSKGAAPQKQVITHDNDSATVEEIDDDEAKKIEELQNLQKRQQEAKEKKAAEGDKKKDGDKKDDEKEEENLKQKPNAGNGG